MRNQQLTQDQLRLVRDQLSAFRPQTPVVQNPAPSAPPPPAAAAAAPVPPPAPVPTPPSQPPSQSLQNLLNSRTLAELIKNTAIRQQPTPPPAIPNVMPQLPQMPQMPQMPAASHTPLPENPLIAALRSRGILPPASAPPVMGSTGQPPTGDPLPFLVPGGMRSTPPVPTPPVSIPVSSTVPMNTASMKM